MKIELKKNRKNKKGNMKVLFTFNVNSIVDVVTNSSSEIFVFKDKEKEAVEEMIEEVYPDYKKEYREVKSLDELSENELDTFILYHWDRWENKLVIAKKLDMDPKDVYTNFDEYKERGYCWYGITRDGIFEKIRKKLKEEYGQMYFLFSKESNPDSNYQEKLSSIGIRYHLG